MCDFHLTTFCKFQIALCSSAASLCTFCQRCLGEMRLSWADAPTTTLTKQHVHNQRPCWAFHESHRHGELRNILCLVMLLLDGCQVKKNMVATVGQPNHIRHFAVTVIKKHTSSSLGWRFFEAQPYLFPCLARSPQTARFQVIPSKELAEMWAQ